MTGLAAVVDIYPHGPVHWGPTQMLLALIAGALFFLSWITRGKG